MDLLGWAALSLLVLLAALFIWLEWRAISKRPDLYGEGGRYGWRSSSIWMLFAVIVAVAAFGFYKLMRSG